MSGVLCPIETTRFPLPDIISHLPLFFEMISFRDAILDEAW
jgi:hypothetical protein